MTWQLHFPFLQHHLDLGVTVSWIAFLLLHLRLYLKQIISAAYNVLMGINMDIVQNLI